MSEYRLGRFKEVGVVDVRRLNAQVKIFPSGQGITDPLVTGPPVRIRRVTTTVTRNEKDGKKLVLTNSKAQAGGDPQVTVITDKPFERLDSGAPIMVELFVRPGTRVFH